MTEIALRTELSIEPGQDSWSDKQAAALKQMGVDNAGSADLAVFFHVCNRTGLDPFARQIYMIGRNSKNQRTDQWEMKFTIQTGIDGYRLVARRATDRAGGTLEYLDGLWCGSDGAWTDVWLADTPPAAAKATVIRDGKNFSAVALMSEYLGTDKRGNPTQMWRDRAAGQLGKCAEALALRKAFPQDLAGLYTADEMHQADQRPAEQPPAPPRRKTNPADPDVLLVAVEGTDDHEELRALWRECGGLSDDSAADLRTIIEAKISPAAEAEPVEAES